MNTQKGISNRKK